MLSALALVLMLLWMRHRSHQMLHRERLAAIEKGAALPPAGREPPPWSPRVYLLRGMIWSFTGAALFVGLLNFSWNARPHQPPTAQSMALAARNVSQYLGVPIEQAREIVAKDEAARAGEFDGPPASLALLGLIPLAVGLAYLLYYRGERSAHLPPLA
jgi:hypothetical protein